MNTHHTRYIYVDIGIRRLIDGNGCTENFRCILSCVKIFVSLHYTNFITQNRYLKHYKLTMHLFLLNLILYIYRLFSPSVQKIHRYGTIHASIFNFLYCFRDNFAICFRKDLNFYYTFSILKTEKKK